ncbi:MAG: hypothetical protein RLZZ303_2581 [Candidatus Hydrogenedentota bacterium]
MRLAAFLFVAVLTVSSALVAEEASVAEHSPIEAAPLETVSESSDPEETTAPAPTAELLTLRQAQEIALRENPSLAAVGLRVEQARQRIIQARSAYFPQASLEYSATRTELPDNTVDSLRNQAWLNIGPNAARSSAFLIGGAPSLLTVGSTTAYTLGQGIRTALNVPTEVETFEASLQLSYLVFDGFAREYTLRAAKLAEQESEAGRRDAQRLLLFGVAQSYFGILLAKENIAIAKADAAFNERLLQEARVSQEAGVASLSDVLNFEVRMRAAESNLIAAEAGLENARIALAALLGMEGSTLPEGVDVDPLAEESVEDLELPEPDTVIASALEHRPDLERARYGVGRNKAFVGQARASFLPRVAAFAARSASLPEHDFEGDDFSTTVGINASVDLFTGGRQWSQLKEAKLATKQSERELDQVELDAIAEVRQAWVSLGEAQQQLVLQRTTAELVQRNRDLVEKEFAAGQAALVRLNEAQRDLVSATSRLALARVGLFLARQELEAATGENLLSLPVE